MRTTLAVGLMAAALLAAVVAAQQPPAEPAGQPPTFRTGVGAVRVDVTVIGKDGLPVRDLTRDDFEVREGGVVQPIQLFQHQQITGDPPEGSDESLAIRSPDHARQEAAREDVRLLVIFIDDYHLKYGSLEDTRLKNGLSRFLQTEMRPLDLMAVMGPLTPISDLGLTRDRTSLLRRVNQLQGRLGGFVPPRSAIEESHLRFGAGDLGRLRAQITLSALHALAVHLGGLREGRKSILFVSQGPPTRAGGLELFSDLQEVIAAANRNNVVVHTLDPRQLGEARLYSAANDALSGNTGGRRIGLSNDYSGALRGVMSDASDYYMLGYESPRSERDGKFRDIDVKVARRGVRVIARSGYWAPRPEEVTAAVIASEAATIPPDVAAALDGLRDHARRVALLDWIGVGAADQGVRTVTVAFEPVAGRSATPPAASVDVSVTLADGTTSTLPAREGPAGFWSAEIQAPPGRLQMRATVKDAAGQVIESWSRDATVPPAGADRLGTPVVYRPTSVAQFRLLKAGADVPPTASRRFRRTDRAIVRLPIASGSLLDLRAELLNRQGNVLRPLTPSAAPVPPAVQVELPLGALAQADYLVRFTAKQGALTTTRVMAFTLAP